MRIKGLAFVLFALFSAAAFAQDPPKISPAGSGTPADAPFLIKPFTRSALADALARAAPLRRAGSQGTPSS